MSEPSAEMRLRLANATLYSLLARLSSPDNPPMPEEVTAALTKFNEPQSLSDLIVMAWEMLPRTVQRRLVGKLRVKDPSRI